MADDKRYMGYWIGHLVEAERNRIHRNGPDFQESQMLAKGEDPWAKFRGPLPPNIPAYIPPETETLGGSDGMWWGHFYISHLSQEERNRIKLGKFQPEEIAKLAKGESPWSWHNPIPGDVRPPADAPPLEEWRQSVIEHFTPIDERIRKAVADAAKSALESKPEEPRGVPVPEQRRHNLPAHGVPKTEKEKRFDAIQRSMPKPLRNDYDKADAEGKQAIWETAEQLYDAAEEERKEKVRREQQRNKETWNLVRRIRNDPTKAHLVSSIPPDDAPMEEFHKWHEEMSKPANRPDYGESAAPGNRPDPKPVFGPGQSPREKAIPATGHPPQESTVYTVPPQKDFEYHFDAKGNLVVGPAPEGEFTTNASSKVEIRRGKRSERKHSFPSAVWKEIKRNKGWYVLAFLLGGLPVGIATIWPTLTHETIPDWLTKHGLPKLETLVIGWVAVALIIALVIVARSCFRVIADSKQDRN